MHTRSRHHSSSGACHSINRSLNASVRANRMRSNCTLSNDEGSTLPTPPQSPIRNTHKTAMEHLKMIETADVETPRDTAPNIPTIPTVATVSTTETATTTTTTPGGILRGVGMFLSRSSSSQNPDNPLLSSDGGLSNSIRGSINRSMTVSMRGLRRRIREPIDRVRLVKRDLGHYQSHNKFGISYIGHDSDITSLLSQDWFHFLLSMNTCTSVMIFLSVWTLVIILFAVAYHLYDRIDPQTNCGLGDVGHPIDIGPAFAFSLETCTTVGYGLPSGSNAFFEANCVGLEIVMYAQMVASMMFNAFLFAFFFSRLARCEKRGLQVIFSNKAIVRQIRNKKKDDGALRENINISSCKDEDDQDDRWLFQTRLYDLNSRMPLVEAHVRLYLLSYENHYDTQEPVQMQPLKLIDPNDDKGAVLYPSVPCVITHHIDENSPLNPRAHETITKKNTTSFSLTHQLNNTDNMVADELFSNCPVCGQTFDTLYSLQRHIHYSAVREDHEKQPVPDTHRDEALVKDVLRKPSSPPPPPPPNFTKEELSDFLRGKEILCVLEGIEPIVSGTFQAIHSYKAEDIMFGQAYFEPCMCVRESDDEFGSDHANNKKKGGVVVDMVKFHTVIDEEDDVKRFVRPRRSSFSLPDSLQSKRNDTTSSRNVSPR